MILAIHLLDLTTDQADGLAHLPTAEIERDLSRLVQIMSERVVCVQVLKGWVQSIPPWNPHLQKLWREWLALGYLLVEEVENYLPYASIMKSLLVYREEHATRP